VAQKDNWATECAVFFPYVAKEGEQLPGIVPNPGNGGVADDAGAVSKRHGPGPWEFVKQLFIQPHCLVPIGLDMRPTAEALAIQAVDGHHAAGQLLCQRCLMRGWA
jgi:hypothetical protein